jgi:nitroreductase
MKGVYTMEVREAIYVRRSIRGFRPDPVSKDLLTEILQMAIQSPSAVNAQPWEFTVITGEALENVKRGYIEKLSSGIMPNPDVPMAPLEGVYKQRQVDLAVEIFRLMGIPREDKARRMEWIQKGVRFYDAPVAIILCADSSLEEARTQFDLGIATQTICLAALDHGLGTCIEYQGVLYPGVLREFTGISESKRITMAIAVGYPDQDFPANKLEKTRESPEKVTTWIGFG